MRRLCLLALTLSIVGAKQKLQPTDLATAGEGVFVPARTNHARSMTTNATLFTGSGAGFNYYLSCIPTFPMWTNFSVPETAFDTSQPLTFPSGFRFTINGTSYSRIAFNRNSVYAVFIPEGASPATFYREILTPTYTSFNDDSVPLKWMAVSPSTANLVRLFCVWCDEYDQFYGNVTWQLFDAPGSRVFRISMANFRHVTLDTMGALSAQMDFYESTGAVKVHFVERSITELQLGAMGVQVSLSSALNVPEVDPTLCPLGADVVYTPDTVAPCDSVQCGPNGYCLAGVCLCINSYWGEYCEINPPRPYITALQNYHDGRHPVNISINIDHLTDVFEFQSQVQVTAIGPGTFADTPPFILSPTSWIVTLLPDPSQVPGPILITTLQNAFGLSLRSTNNITLPFAPTAVITLRTPGPLIYDGVSAVPLLLTLSGPVHDFHPWLVEVEGAGEVQPLHLEVVEAGRIFTVMFVPTLEDVTVNCSIWLPEGAINNGLSIQSEPLVLDYVPAPRNFSYSHDFDGNGFVYWMGTNRSTTPWSNPGKPSCHAPTSCLNFTRASGDSVTSTASCVAEVTFSVCYTAPVPDAWWQVDLGEHLRFQLRDYTLRDGENYFREMISNWVLQASNDQLHWMALATYVNNTAIATPNSSATFRNVDGFRRESDIGYRYFRIVQIGRNLDGSYYLNLSGMELYGLLYNAGDPCANINCGFFGTCSHETKGKCVCNPGYLGDRCLSSPESRRTSFTYQHDFDTNGLMYYLGTDLNRTTTWINPETRGFVRTNRSSDLAGVPRNQSRCILDLLPQQCETNSDVNAWWLLDMSPVYLVQLTGYTLRDGSNASHTMIRYFVFQGSKDGRVWETIGGSHSNDKSIKEPYGSSTWLVDRTPAFRYLRVTQTDRNAGGTYFLSLSGLELYGTLYDPNDECASVNCGNNGVCTSGAICSCSPGFSGLYCQNVVVDAATSLLSAGSIALVVIISASAFGGVVFGGMAYVRYRNRKPPVKVIVIDPEAIVHGPSVLDERTGEKESTVFIPLTLNTGANLLVAPEATGGKPKSKPRIPIHATGFSFTRAGDAPSRASPAPTETDEVVLLKKEKRSKQAKVQPGPLNFDTAEEWVTAAMGADSEHTHESGAGHRLEERLVDMEETEELEVERLDDVEGSGAASHIGGSGRRRSRSSRRSSGGHGRRASSTQSESGRVSFRKGSKPPSSRLSGSFHSQRSEGEGAPPGSVAVEATRAPPPPATVDSGPLSTDVALLSIIQERSQALSVEQAEAKTNLEQARIQMLNEAAKATHRRVNKMETTPWGARKIKAVNMMEHLAANPGVTVRPAPATLLVPHIDARMSEKTRGEVHALKVKQAVGEDVSVAFGTAKVLLLAERE